MRPHGWAEYRWREDREKGFPMRMNSSKRCIYMLAVALAAVLAAGQAVVLSAETQMSAPVNYPNAGISIALPTGFEIQAPSDASAVVSAARSIGGRPAQAVSLTAFCVGAKITTADCADQAERALSLAVRKFQSLKSVPIKVAGITGIARLLKYTFRGEPTTAARVFFVRELKSDGVRICYVVTVEVKAKYEQTLLPTLDKVIKTIKLTAVQSPGSIPVSLSDKELKSFSNAFSIRLPRGWFGSVVDDGINTGQTNYLAGGVPSPQISVLSRILESDTTSESCAKLAMSRHLDASTRPDSGVKVISQGPTKVGENDAYQFIIKMTYKIQVATQPANSTTTQPANGGKVVTASKIQAVRVVCRKGEGERPGRAYFITLSCLEADAKLVSKWLDTLAEGFKFLPLPKPTTKPATPAKQP